MKELLLVFLSVFVVSVSCCCDGRLQCMSGKCSSVGALCDFKADCEDGSDEEFCGSCDFERHSCGWNDASTGDKRWSLVMANVTSKPGIDHSTGSPLGHVMFIDGQASGNGRQILEYNVNNRTALGCQISFWYHMYDAQPMPLMSPLYLKMVRGSDWKNLAGISGRNTNGWKNDTAFIGNQPGGYKLLFSYDASFFGATDVMLDDISFEYCREGDIPAGSDRLSCDFEDNTCSWYHDYTASILWKSSKEEFSDGGPGSDHTTGDGYYMFVETERGLDPSATARLVSFPQPAGQVICVTFWYHIFGTSIGSLSFITKHGDEQETAVWVKNGTQGDKWRFADLTFTSETPIQFMFEAVVGGTQGSIAIDDVVVSSSENGSCPAERECTFQGSLCGLTPQPSADFSWSRKRGTPPTNSPGPTIDHTLGTELGYYLSAHLWRHPVGSNGSMVTAVMEPTPHSGECWMFWYYMEGRGVGKFNIYLQTPGDPKGPIQLWTRSGNQGNLWRHGRVTVVSPNSPYQVIFEAVVGDGLNRDIAIDDLTVLNGVCPPTGFCDFEMDYCGWVNNAPAESGVDWDWRSGSSGGMHTPGNDHTTGSTFGHFVIFSSYGSRKEEIAHLESEWMEAVDSACLEFWHYAEGWIADRPSPIELTMFVRDTTALHLVWKTNGYMNRTWNRARVDYNASRPHQIILQARRLITDSGSFSLDDIHIKMGVACGDVVPTTTPYPTTSGSTSPVSPLDCAFEQGLCSWSQESSNDFNWTRGRGIQMDQPWDGPLVDHTIGNKEGFYLLMNGSSSKDRASAAISIPITVQKSHICVGFWYYMLGPSVSTLDLLVESNSSEQLAWTRQGSQDPKWTNAQVNIDTSNGGKIVFVGHKNISSRGFIAIDDIKVTEGNCSSWNLGVCGFDSDDCDLENDVSHMGRWVRKKGTEDRLDHTYGTENGFYKTVMQPNTTEPEVAQLLTSELRSTAAMCARFWYWLSAGSSDILSVHVLQSGEDGPALWQRSGAPSRGWEVAELTLSSPYKFRVAFKAIHAPDTTSTVQIDDVSMRAGACTPTGSCDFESGQCTWVNVHKDDGHDWVQADGHFGGPSIDHTTHTPEGMFLLSPSQPQNHTSRALIGSEWIHLKNSTFCLTFWYYMANSDSGTLRVFVRSGLSEAEQIFQISSGGPNWVPFSDSAMRTEPFQVLIEAESTDSGFIAIDDVSVTPGLCPVNETSGGFVGCSFENNTCGWEDISLGHLQWQRGRNASDTDSAGPSVDNTLGNELGWYMAVHAHQREANSSATFQSPTMKQASATCTLHFYYHIYGEGIGKMQVLLKESSRITPLWWLSGDQGDLWHHSEVTVGRTPQDFDILFQATRNFSVLGDIAIDDIDFSNCTLPEPQPLCPVGMFACNNSVCVEQSRVCDFSDDCGDESDETNCVQQGILERCSFEQGLCFWANSEVDTPGANWTHTKAQHSWPGHGPPRDHTQNTAAGHYIIPVTKQTGQTSEILSVTLLPSANCTVRFFYYRLDDATSRLTVHSRTLQSGSEDVLLWIWDKSQSYSWQRAEVTFSSAANSKVVFRYEQIAVQRGLVALDDTSFSKECVIDPDNSQLPVTSTTSAPPTSSTTPANPCQDNEFFCWRSEGKVCVLDSVKCDYHLDCPLGEDEDACGPCTFENGQCQWTDSSDGKSRWQRERASNNTIPPSDHTTNTGHYMKVNFSGEPTNSEARLQSPVLPPSSAYCQMLFHFHMNGRSIRSLRVLMQQAEGNEATLWSRSHNTASQWTSEYISLGWHQQPYKVLFSSKGGASRGDAAVEDTVVAVDDISFLNCENSFKPPALSAYSCSFENDLCGWVQGAEDELDWQRRSGPTETPNTGPAGDHTTGTGQYMYINSSPPSVRGNVAQLKSSLLPPADEVGYCFRFWYHMFGATVGSLKMVLQTADPLKKTLVWQQSGNQGDEWQLAQSHVTFQEVHQVILEGSVGGVAGNIAIDDIRVVNGPCPASDLCDFEEGSCNWQQQINDDCDWVRHSGSTLNPNTGPDGDHTTNTPTGHYYYLPSAVTDRAGQTAKMSSPLYPAETGKCVQLWYHMYGDGMGTLNVYQQSEEGDQVLLFSQMGDQGNLWRLGQAPLSHVQPYRIVVEGVKAGPTQTGDMAFDDVSVISGPCSPPGHCDFEISLCGWSNLGGGTDQGDWLRGRGASPNPNTGPSVDHTTDSALGYYLYVDSSAGKWGDTSLLISDVIHPTTRGQCLKFWYHMYGHYIGTLSVYINDRKMQTGTDQRGILKWTESGNQGDQWLEGSVSVQHGEPFWFVFVYQRGMKTGGDAALDDITVLPGPCDSEPPTSSYDTLSIWLPVGLTLLAGVIISAVLFMRNRRRPKISQPNTPRDSLTDQNSMFDLYDCTIKGTNHGSESEFSFFNKLYDSNQEKNSPTEVTSYA